MHYTVPMQHVCEHCGKVFKMKGNRPRRFCSRACYELGRTERTDRVCPTCGKTYSVPTAQLHKFRVCSWECRTARTTYAPCPRCGTMFNNKRGRMTHCSEACRRPLAFSTCETCGENFRHVPSASPRYCCFACYRRSTAETTPERLVRESLERIGCHFVQEYRVGRYSLDFAVPDLATDIEVDGDYWHRDERRNAKRDAALADLGWQTIRIKESTINDIGEDLDLYLRHKLAWIDGLLISRI